MDLRLPLLRGPCFFWQVCQTYPAAHAVFKRSLYGTGEAMPEESNRSERFLKLQAGGHERKEG